MKSTILIALCFITMNGICQKKPPVSTGPLTKTYAGTYGFGTNPERGPSGAIIVYPETDSTVLFYLDVSRGAPSYNMGALYGRVMIVNGTGEFYSEAYATDDMACRWRFIFTSTSLTIATIGENYECGFGAEVIADGVYKRKSKTASVYFIDMDGNKVYFNKTSPETYSEGF